MSNIRKVILQQMANLGLNIYQVAQIVKDSIPKRTVYAFLSGEKDTGTRTASIIMDALGLKIEIEKDVAKRLRENQMERTKSNKFMGRVKSEWGKAGKPKWSPRELLGICLLIDLELRIEGLNPAPTFREYVESKKYSKALGWAQGLKIKTWK
jgi:hypothetical protein